MLEVKERDTLDFRYSPTIGDFILDYENIYKGIIGPLGSGKTTGVIAKLFDNAKEQMVDPRSGYIRSRMVIIRNTSPELKSTTINTWKEVFPEDRCGPIVFSAPIRHHIIIPKRGEYGKEGFTPGFDMENLFIPLDVARDVAKLRSLDITSAFVNEASEVVFAIIKMLRGRRGRFPPRALLRDGKGGTIDYQAVNPQILMDTNAPDSRHWIAKFEADEKAGKKRRGFKFYKQPAAVVEVDLFQGKYCGKLNQYRHLEFERKDCFMSEDGDLFAVNLEEAENLPFLRDDYYQEQIEGNDSNWISKNLGNQYIFASGGKPVINNYDADYFERPKLDLLPGVPLQIGADIGGSTLNPAAVIAQRNPDTGGWLFHREVICEDMGMNNFAVAVNQTLADYFDGFSLLCGWGDPAGMKPDEVYEAVIFDFLKKRGLAMRPAPSNNPKLRIEAYHQAMNRRCGKEPGLLISKEGCPVLCESLAGRWEYKRKSNLGEEVYSEQPNKNHPFSDICDGGGYLLLGGGEHRIMKQGTVQQPAQQTTIAKIDFDLWSR